MDSNDCIPKIMKSIKDLSQNSSGPVICMDVSRVNTYYSWNQLMEHAGNCQRPCTIVEYQGTIKKYLGWGNFNEGNTMISILFPTKEVRLQEEYLIYGIVDLIGIVGGNLGLFIGFSFYDVIKCVLDIFWK